MEAESNLPPEDNFSLASEEKHDFLWKVLARFDQYIAATNAKAAFILAFNAVILLLVANWLTKPLVQSCPWNSTWVTLWNCAICALVISVVANVILTLIVVAPNVSSPRSSQDYQSAIFFGDIAKMEPKDFQSKLHKFTPLDLGLDLAIQVNKVAQIVSQKFKYMRHVFDILVFIEIPLFVILAGLKTFWY